MSDSSQPKNSLDNLTFDTQSIDEILKNCTIDLGATGANMNDVTIIPTYSTGSSNNYSYSDTISTVTIGGAGGTYSIQPLTTADTITLTGINSYSAFNIPKEWVDTFPSWSRVQDMCEKYPGLKIAFDNFKVFYEMVKDDYDNPTPKK